MSLVNQDYLDFKRLEAVVGYKKLEALWIHQVSEIEKSRDRAASRNSESSWRYAAGKEAGFKLAMTALQRAIADIEAKEQDVREESVVDRMMEDLRLKGDQNK